MKFMKVQKDEIHEGTERQNSWEGSLETKNECKTIKQFWGLW